MMRGAIDEPPLLWHGDPSVIVYAVRHVLEHPGSHAPELVAQTVELNADVLPESARRLVTRAIRSWLRDPSTRPGNPRRAVWEPVVEALELAQARAEAHR